MQSEPLGPYTSTATFTAQIQPEFNLNSSDFIPNSNSCEFERIRFQ